MFINIVALRAFGRLESSLYYAGQLFALACGQPRIGATSSFIANSYSVSTHVLEMSCAARKKNDDFGLQFDTLLVYIGILFAPFCLIVSHLFRTGCFWRCLFHYGTLWDSFLYAFDTPLAPLWHPFGSHLVSFWFPLASFFILFAARH